MPCLAGLGVYDERAPLFCTPTVIKRQISLMSSNDRPSKQRNPDSVPGYRRPWPIAKQRLCSILKVEDKPQEEGSMANEKKYEQYEDSEDEKPDEATPEENPPDPTWKHPDDGKSLSDLDQEWPLKP
jgi:hypothetical protein